MKVKIKICGIRSLESAQAAIRAGADFIGFNFVKQSPRYVHPRYAKEIQKRVHGKLKTVGVFQNEKIDLINAIVDLLGLDYVQLHGQESKSFAEKIQAKIIKVCILSTKSNSEKIANEIKNYKPDLALLDLKKGAKQSAFDIKQSNFIAKQFPVFIAGGLNPDNVEKMVVTIKPYGVDAARGIETYGHEDIGKIYQFISAAKKINI